MRKLQVQLSDDELFNKLEDFLIEGQDVKKGKKLGSGCFGDVYIATCKVLGGQIAAKTLKSKCCQSYTLTSESMTWNI